MNIRKYVFMNDGYLPTERITFVITEKEKIDLKITAILTKKSMSDFIRLAIKDKIKDIKGQENGHQ